MSATSASAAASEADGATGLDARLRLDRAAFTLDVHLTAAPGDVLALLGPNGAGKTTALRQLAGLAPSDAARVVLDGAVLDGPGRHVPPEERPCGVVFQDYLLFPHLSARENVAFGPRARGVRRAEARAAADHWLATVGLAEVAARRPRELSGGQAQRVALARALATQPRLLLLDEPLAALDAATRLSVRADLRRHLERFPGVTVLVTHDPLDAMVLASRVVVLEDGRVVQDGAPGEVARRPRTSYVARLVGLNLLRGIARDGVVDLAEGGRLAAAGGEGGTVSGPALVAFAPSAVALHRHRPEGSPRNAWPVQVGEVERHGDTVRVRLEGSPAVSADVTTGAVADLGLIPGASVWAAVKATEVTAYPA